MRHIFGKSYVGIIDWKTEADENYGAVWLDWDYCQNALWYHPRQGEWYMDAPYGLQE